MPEGPSIVILKELAEKFTGKVIRSAEGNSKIELSRLVGQRIVAFRNFGKQFLIELPTFSVRIHLLMFGSYRIDERTDKPPRLRLTFSRGEINFYSCSVRFIDEPLDDVYDWRGDVLSDAWNPALARKRLRAEPDTLVCDALLDQDIFAGVGNIIKNEVLFRIRVHPLSTIGGLPARKLNEMIREARTYSFDFLKWKKEFTLREHWLAHNRSVCPRDHVKFERAHLGVRKRRTFYCELCQKKYVDEAAPKRSTVRPERKRKAPKSKGLR
jgi:endonuclease VIII